MTPGLREKRHLRDLDGPLYHDARVCAHVRLPLPAARSFGLKTSFLNVISKGRRDKAEHNPRAAVDRPRSAKGAVIF